MNRSPSLEGLTIKDSRQQTYRHILKRPNTIHSIGSRLLLSANLLVSIWLIFAALYAVLSLHQRFCSMRAIGNKWNKTKNSIYAFYIGVTFFSSISLAANWKTLENTKKFFYRCAQDYDVYNQSDSWETLEKSSRALLSDYFSRVNSFFRMVFFSGRFFFGMTFFWLIFFHDGFFSVGYFQGRFYFNRITARYRVTTIDYICDDYHCYLSIVDRGIIQWWDFVNVYQ